LCNQSYASNPIFQNFDVEDGLPSSFVYEVIQDDSGLIWIATNQGLSKYDGNQFENYTVKDGLPNNDIFGLTKDSQGRIWLSTLDKLSYLKDGQFYILKDYKDLGIVDHYFGKNGEHFVSSTGKQKSFLVNADFELIEIQKDRDHILEYTDELNYRYARSFSAPGNDFQYILVDVQNGISKGNEIKLGPYNRQHFGMEYVSGVHISTSPDGIQFLDSESTVYLDLKKLGLTQKIEKTFFIEDGVYLKANNKEIFIDKDRNISDRFTFCKSMDLNGIYQDKEENYWLSSANGLFFISGLSINSENYQIVDRDGFSRQKPIKIIKNVKGDILIGTYEGNIYSYTTSGLILEEKIGIEGLRDMVQDDYGFLWLAYDNEGCFRLKDIGILNNSKYEYPLNHLTKRTKNLKAVLKTTVKSLNMGPDKRLYIASADGIYQIEFEVDHFKIKELDDKRSYSVAQDLYGYIWIGRSSGISRFKDGKLVNVESSHLASDLSVTDIAVDSKNGLWIGSDGYGLFHDKGTSFCSIEELDGYIINSLMIDDDRVWAATNRGVVSIASLTGKNDKCEYDINIYSISHGLASDEVYDVFVDDGYIYAATKNGVSRIKIDNSKNDLDASSYRSPLLVQSISINGQPQEINSNFDLEHYQNNIKIDYAGLSYQSLGKVTYEYQMEPLDTSWQATDKGYREYQGLQPGEYTFRLRAKDIDGNFLNNSQFLKFRISQPWYKRWWFYLISILLLLGSFYLFTRYRDSKLRKEAKRESENSRRFAELEMQAIRSQMNPHFLFNALHSIQDFIFTNDSREANRYISSFASLMRKILDASKKKYVYIYEEIEMLELYLELEKLRFNEKFEYKLMVDSKIDINATEIPTMIIQPFVENAINHGLLHREDSGLLLIKIEQAKEGVKITVADNGIGIEQSKKIKLQLESDHVSQGMALINNRLEIMNEMYNTEIKFSLTEQHPEDRKYPGTKITLEIPDLT
jgi:two-component sensor histidine kinase